MKIALAQTDGLSAFERAMHELVQTSVQTPALTKPAGPDGLVISNDTGPLEGENAVARSAAVVWHRVPRPAPSAATSVDHDRSHCGNDESADRRHHPPRAAGGHPDDSFRCRQAPPDGLSNFPFLPDSAFVRLPVVCGLFSISAATVWRYVKRKMLPSPVKLSARVTAWRVGDLRAALDSAGS